jgi:hypothetical protein
MIKNFLSKDLLTGLKFAKISVTTAGAGDGTLVAAVTGKKIRVYAFGLALSAAVSATFQSGTAGTALTGDMPFAINGNMVAAFSPVGHFETAAATLLNLHLSAAATASGWLVYSEVA